MSGNCNLPEELIVEILFRLPVVFLIQFRLVCKWWLAIISNPRFIQEHLSRTSLNPQNNTLFVSRIHSAPELKFTRIDSFQISVDFHYPIPRICRNEKLSVVGSSHGLVCFFGKGKIVFWNPATKQLKGITVPKSELGSGSLGFGYDSVDGDFRFVSIMSYYSQRTKLYHAEVYSCNMDTWKKVNIVTPQYAYTVKCHVIVKGTPYWSFRDVVVAFDFHDEALKQYPLPGYSSKWQDRFGVVNWMDSVAIIQYFSDEESNNRVVLYTLNESCGAWIKNYNVPIFERPYRMPMPTCLKNGLIVIKEDFQELSLFDPKTKQLKILRNLKPQDWSLFDVMSYTESLLYINGMKQIQEEEGNKKTNERDDFLSKGFKLKL